MPGKKAGCQIEVQLNAQNRPVTALLLYSNGGGCFVSLHGLGDVEITIESFNQLLGLAKVDAAITATEIRQEHPQRECYLLDPELTGEYGEFVVAVDAPRLTPDDTAWLGEQERPDGLSGSRHRIATGRGRGR